MRLLKIRSRGLRWLVWIAAGLLVLTISIAGAMGVATLACGINPLQFLSSIPRFTSMGTLGAGLAKSLVYGGIVASVACHQGYTASGGAKGVGKAVTRAAVTRQEFADTRRAPGELP